MVKKYEDRFSAWAGLARIVETLKDDPETEEIRSTVNKARNDLHKLGIYHEK